MPTSVTSRDEGAEQGRCKDTLYKPQDTGPALPCSDVAVGRERPPGAHLAGGGSVQEDDGPPHKPI
jgi:hypothetical protein